MSTRRRSRIAAVIGRAASPELDRRCAATSTPTPSRRGRSTAPPRALLERPPRRRAARPRSAPPAPASICDARHRRRPIVAIRGDIDALRMQDTKEVPYRSTVDGVCHSCGHDLHATAVVGAAIAIHRELLGARRHRPGAGHPPAGRGVGARRRRVAGGRRRGRRRRTPCSPSTATRPARSGSIGASAGPITSAADQIDDPPATGRAATPAAPTRPRTWPTSPPAWWSTCRWASAACRTPATGSTSRSARSRWATPPTWSPPRPGCSGSLRASGRGAWEAAPHHIARLLPAIVEPLGATWELDHQTGAPPIVNDPWAVDRIRAAAAAVVGPEHVGSTEQSAGGEDFSWYGEQARLGYFRLGVWDPAGLRVDLHAGGFDLHERAIGLGRPRPGRRRARGARRPRPPLERAGTRLMDTAELDYELPDARHRPDARSSPATRPACSWPGRRRRGPAPHRGRPARTCSAPGDLLVVNDTRVIPARLHLRKPTGGAVEVLLLERRPEGHWEALVRPSRRVADGTVLRSPDAGADGLHGRGGRRCWATTAAGW